MKSSLTFIDRLQAFVRTVTAAKTEAELDQAACYFADTMRSGVNIARALFMRRKTSHQPSHVVRAHSKGGSGSEKRPSGQQGEHIPSGRTGTEPSGPGKGSDKPGKGGQPTPRGRRGAMRAANGTRASLKPSNPAK